MTIRIFDAKPEKLLEKLNKEGLRHPIDGKPFKIRVRFDGVKYSTRKQIIKYLQKKGFEQLGNSSSWLLKHMD